MAFKTVQVARLLYQNVETGQTEQVKWNLDDGAFQYYTGPGDGWILIGQDIVTEQQVDYDAPVNPMQPPVPVPQPPAAIAPHQGGNVIYRLILVNAQGGADTGATYPGCSVSNPQACQPQQLATLDDAVRWAADRGETPVLVQSVDEAWAIVGGRGVDPAQILTPAPAGGILDMLPSFSSSPLLYLSGGWLLYKTLFGRRA